MVYYCPFIDESFTFPSGAGYALFKICILRTQFKEARLKMSYVATIPILSNSLRFVIEYTYRAY
jgi:hypothetical protein